MVRLLRFLLRLRPRGQRKHLGTIQNPYSTDWTRPSLFHLIESNPARLANKETFVEILSTYPEEKHDDVLFALLKKGVTMTEQPQNSSPGQTEDLRKHLPSIAKNILPHFAVPEKWELWDGIAALLTRGNLWKHRDVTLTWFEAGLPLLEQFWMNPRSHPMLQIDEEMYLLIAERCVGAKGIIFTCFLQDQLKRKKEFMTEVVKRDPALYGACWTPDLDVATIAFANAATFCDDFIFGCWLQKTRAPDFYAKLANHLQFQLAAHHPLQDPLLLPNQQNAGDLGQQTGDFETLRRAERNLSRYMQDPNVKARQREFDLESITGIMSSGNGSSCYSSWAREVY